MQVRTLIQREMGAALQQYDALLCPAAPTPAYRVGEKAADPLAMYKGGWVGLCICVGLTVGVGEQTANPLSGEKTADPLAVHKGAWSRLMGWD